VEATLATNKVHTAQGCGAPVVLDMYGVLPVAPQTFQMKYHPLVTYLFDSLVEPHCADAYYGEMVSPPVCRRNKPVS
jgi:hypothetical protein